MATQAPAVRVLLANLPGVIGQMLAVQIEAAQDLQIVDQVEGQVEVLMAVRQGVDVVILGVPHLKPPPGLVSHLLNEFPTVKVLALSVRDNTASGYWLGVRCRRINNITSARLIASIRILNHMLPSV